MTQLSLKHHFIPVFYLKRWTGSDGKLCEFTRQWKGVVKPKRTHPSGTGYVKRLYETVTPGSNSQQIEDLFFKPVDTMASEALEKIYDKKTKLEMNLRERIAWSRFILSLLLRSPEDLDDYKKHYAENWLKTNPRGEERYKQTKADSDPETLSEFLIKTDPAYVHDSSLEVLKTLIENKTLINRMCDFNWHTVTLNNPRHYLMTSDRPVIMTNGLARKDSYIVMPIGPRQIFLTAPYENAVLEFKKMTEEQLVTNINYTIVGQAQKYVFGKDDVQLRFVQKYMSIHPRPSLINSMQNLHDTDSGQSQDL
jgi:hypothetical protein